MRVEGFRGRVRVEGRAWAGLKALLLLPGLDRLDRLPQLPTDLGLQGLGGECGLRMFRRVEGGCGAPALSLARSLSNYRACLLLLFHRVPPRVI